MPDSTFARELAVLRNRRRLSWLGSAAVVAVLIVVYVLFADAIGRGHEWVALAIQFGILTAMLIPFFSIATAKCPRCGENFFVKAKFALGVSQIRPFANACVSCQLGLRPPESKT